MKITITERILTRPQKHDQVQLYHLHIADNATHTASRTTVGIHQDEASREAATTLQSFGPTGPLILPPKAAGEDLPNRSTARRHRGNGHLQLEDAMARRRQASRSNVSETRKPTSHLPSIAEEAEGTASPPRRHSRPGKAMPAAHHSTSPLLLTATAGQERKKQGRDSKSERGH
jgi:hypothetical protein